MKLSVTLTREEQYVGLGYLLAELLVIPYLLNFLNMQLRVPLTGTEQNILFFILNFCCTMFIFRKFLLRTFRTARPRLWNCLRYAFLGLLLFQLCNFLLPQLMRLIRPDFFNVNDYSFQEMARSHFRLLMAVTVFLVPITEECLFRGVFFCGFYRRSRILAYTLSTALFALVHVAGYVGKYDLGMLLLCYLQYIPVGIILAWAYEKSDSILSPVLLHMTINQLGFLFLR